MASRSLGQLTIDLIAKIGGFTAGMTEAERVADRKGRDIARKQKSRALEVENAWKSVRNSFAGNFFAAAFDELLRNAARLPGAFNDLAKGAGTFKDIEDRIGGAAEGIAGFAVAAGTAGIEVNEVANFSVRLTKALSKVDEESDSVAKALKRINIPVEEFKKLDPVSQMERLAKALAGFGNGPEKAAVLEAIVRGGSQLLPFLKTLEEQGGRQNILTREQILLADEYADRQAKASTELKLYAQAAATQATPAFTALQDVAIETAKALLGVGSASAGLAANNAVRTFAEDSGRAIASFADYVKLSTKELRVLIDFISSTAKATQQLLSLDFQGARTTGEEFRRRYGLDELGRRQAQAGKEAGETFVEAYNKALTQGRALALGQNPQDLARRGRGQPTLPQIDVRGLGGNSGSGGKDDPTKKLLDNRLKEIEAASKREQEIAEDRNRFLSIYNDQGLISIKAYYDAQKAILDAGTSAQIEAYNKQIDALKVFQEKSGKATDRAESQGKINELIEKRAALEQKAGAKGLEFSIKQQEAERRLAEEIKSVNASLLELQGNFAAAAAIRFDQQNLELVRRLMAEGNTEALKMVEALRQATIAQAEYNKANVESQRALGGLANEEDRISISRQLGATTELESLQRLGEARRAAAAQLEGIVSAQEEIARASANPELIRQAEKARIELEKLKAIADPLGDKFKGIFEDSFGDAFGDFITGAKSAKDAFKSFADSVFQQISRIVAQNLAQSLFGNIGTIAGFGGGTFDLGKILGFAGGGFPPVGRASLVGEEGPELFVPNTAGRIIPAGETAKMMGGMNLTQNFAFSGAVDQRTQSQVAAAALRGAQTALGRT